MRWSRWVGFVVLCLVAATSWAIPPIEAGGVPALEQQGILFGVIGAVAFVFLVFGAKSPGAYLRIAGGSVGLFGVPLVIAEYARGSVPAVSRSALFALVPVVVVIAVAAGEMAAEEQRVRNFLVPALIGVGGLLLLLPLEIPGSLRGRLMLVLVCCSVVLVGAVSVWLYRQLQGDSLIAVIALAGLANGLFLLGWSAFHEEMVWRYRALISVVSISSFVDGLEVLLIVWLLRDLPPIRFSSRYLVIPLLTVLESYVVERPHVTARMIGGTVLLAAGAGLLLFLKARDEETILSLR